jgi:hypothetical protein
MSNEKGAPRGIDWLSQLMGLARQIRWYVARYGPSAGGSGGGSTTTSPFD